MGEDEAYLRLRLEGDPATLFRVKVVTHTAPMDRPDNELLTFRLVFPRVILAEVNTHRVLSKSAESSRAIPAAVRLAQVRDNPYRPLKLKKNKAGMQAGDVLGVEEQRAAAGAWNGANAAVCTAMEQGAAAGLHKEEVNRLGEPFALVRQVLTGTEWANFFALRTHGDAHPAFQFLARAMYVALRRSKPKLLNYGEWHLPFVNPDTDGPAVREYMRQATAAGRLIQRRYGVEAAREYAGEWFGGKLPEVFRGWEEYHLCRWSAARCARVSYGKTAAPGLDDWRKDDATWAKLVGLAGMPLAAATINPAKLMDGATAWPYRPIHPSPMEHQGTPLHVSWAASRPHVISNLRGYYQFRRALGGETIRTFDPPADAVREWEDAIPDAVFDGADPF